jgi:serine acetyltransferase
MSSQMHISVHSSILLLYQLHTNRYFRTLFYYRVGTIGNLLLSWYRPGDRYFTISYTTQIGEGINLVHPYATILNAESIGKNFTCLHCTTIGKSNGKKPVIGDDVTLGAHVCIIGGVHIGSNVQIGAGSVVVKDIPSNCIAVGNPAKPIKFLDENVSIF